MDSFSIEAPVIAALLSGDGRAGEIIAALRTEDFSEGINQAIFSFAVKLFSEGSPVNATTVANEIARKNPEESAESLMGYISGLSALVPKDAAYYVRALKENNLLRDYREAGQALQRAGSITEAEKIVQDINGLTAQSTGQSSFTALQAALDFADRLEKRRVNPTNFTRWGLPPLDSELFVQPGDFVVIGGRPSAGKTLLALQLACTMAQTQRVGFVSLETSKEKLTERALSHQSGVPLWKIKKPQNLTDEDTEKLTRAADVFSKLDLEIADQDNRTVPQIRAMALNRRWQVVFVDYLQIVGGTGKTPYEKVTAVSRSLQELAKTTGVLVVALAQLSRAGSQETGAPPTLESFRESGQVEQDADVAMLLYLENPHDKGGNRILKVAKNKEGGLFDVPLVFDGARQTLTYAGRTA